MTSTALLLCLMAPPARAAGAIVSDPIAHVAIKTNGTMMELHNRFMQTQMVKDAVILKNSYLEAKKYYDAIDERSRHAGGIVGYYKDYFEEQLTNTAAAEWRRLNLEANSITGPTPVSKLVAGVTDNINKQVDRGFDAAEGGVAGGMLTLDGGYAGVRGALFTRAKAETEAADNVLAESEKRADRTAEKIRDLVRRGSAPLGVTQKERESIEMSASLLQLQLLAEVRQLLNVNAQVLNSQAKKNLAEMSVSLKTSQDLAGYRRQAARKRQTAAASSDRIVRELKRKPGEQ